MDSRGPAPCVVGAFRPSVFPDTILPGSFCPLERRALLGGGAKSFLRLFRHAASRFSAARDGRRVVRRDGSSRPSLRGKSWPERSLIPVVEGVCPRGSSIAVPLQPSNKWRSLRNRKPHERRSRLKIRPDNRARRPPERCCVARLFRLEGLHGFAFRAFS